MRILGVMTLVLTLGLGLAVPQAFAADIVWQGDPGDNWSDDAEWVGGNEPGPSDHAIINNGNWCKIPVNYTAAVCQRITIASGNEVRMKKGSVLTLGNQDQTYGSTIDGMLTIGSDNEPATLDIKGDHTITGDGGVIKLQFGSPITNSVADPQDLLTLKGNCNVTCEVLDKPTRACSLVVTGEGAINAPLFNDAFVVADNSTLKLALGDKDSGCCGFWVAMDGGTLGTKCPVAGKGAWYAQDETDPVEYGGNIIIGYEDVDSCVQTEGNVFVTGWFAKLIVEANDGFFCTKGSLTHRSIEGDGYDTQPVISAGASPNIATFGVTTCPDCP